LARLNLLAALAALTVLTVLTVLTMAIKYGHQINHLECFSLYLDGSCCGNTCNATLTGTR
jgi:hypothetical protein